MNDRLCYSLSSNWLVRSEMFDRKKHLTELQLMNRFRKMHLYDAIHSLSGKKLHKNSKTPNTQFLTHQSSSSKNIAQSKPHKKQPFPFNSIVIQQREDQHQNKLIKLKHFNNQKSRPQTSSKLPMDSRKQAINKLWYEQNISNRKRELIVRAEKVATNNQRSGGQQRLSIKLSSKSGANEYNSKSEQHKANKQAQKRIKKWQTSNQQQAILQDYKKVRLSNIDSYQIRTTKQRQQQDEEQQYEIGRWSSHYNNQSQQQLRQTQLSQVDEEDLMDRDERIDISSSTNNYLNDNENSNNSGVNSWRMSLQHHHQQDYAAEIKKKHPHPHPKKDQTQHHNNHKNVKFIVDNITYTPKYSITNFKSHPHLDIDNNNFAKNYNHKQGSMLRKNISLQKLRPLTGGTKDNDKQNIELVDTPKHPTLITDDTDNNIDNLRGSKKSEKHNKRQYIHKFIKSKSNKKQQENGEINKKEIDSNGKQQRDCYFQNEEHYNIELQRQDRESSTDQFAPW